MMSLRFVMLFVGEESATIDYVMLFVVPLAVREGEKTKSTQRT